MPKQIKIGFDRSISPKVTKLEPLYDITGFPLLNENDEPLTTLEFGPLESFFTSKKSLPIHVNNEKSPVKIIEQFPETSQVSSSLLGVPRAEEQLGLFSDVSTYGFNENIWEFFTIGYGKNPPEWLYRKNKTYGNRYSVKAVEIPEEQSIALQAFPVPWTYPYGPAFQDQGLYDPDTPAYEYYVNFFRLGRALYDNYIDDENEEIEKFAANNFLPPHVGSIENNEVIYNPNLKESEVFEEIEKWTMAWIKMKSNNLFLPNNQQIKFPWVDAAGFAYTSNNTRPGYENGFQYYGEITSKKSYRYQPGRISGFTFGLRSSSDQASVSNIIEWGCANSTDEYVFQIKGPNFNIVRRSTVPLPSKNLEDMGLTLEDQIEVSPLNPYAPKPYNPDTGEYSDAKKLWETVITRDYFNGDRLDGDGPSGYILTPEQVTMYKIEFSWYGAIGAKFYAYVPAGNGDARWVLIHTLVIENKIGEPCLNDPYFRFLYRIKINDTTNLVAPQFVYKYGASYYIDGGDEGTSTSYSTSSQEVLASPLYTRSVLGLTSKFSLKNREGVSIRNKKDIIPESISITTDNPIKLDIIECEGCPGFGHNYAPSLHNAQTGIVSTFTFDNSGTRISYNNPLLEFTPEDVGKKIIGDGIYSTYIANVDITTNTAKIARKIRPLDIYPVPNENQTYATSTQVVFGNGQTTSVKNNSFTLRLTGYNTNSIAVSTVGLTKPNIDVNFMNPTEYDGPTPSNRRSFADFFIGVTNKTPTLEFDTVNEYNNILFGGQPFDLEELLYAEWTNYRLEQDYRGYDVVESDERYGTEFEIEPQVPRPPGENSGACSRMNIRVSEFVINNVEHDTTTPGGPYILFPSTESVFQNLTGLLGGKIGILSGDSYVESTTSFAEDKALSVENNEKYRIKVSNADLVGQQTIAIRVLRLKGRYFTTRTKVFSSFNVYPLYIVFGMRDNAKINNIIIEEYDDLGKFTYTPTWMTTSVSSVSVVPTGVVNESINNNNGLFSSGGLSIEGDPSANYAEINRSSSALIDKQLQQPLRPGQVRSSLFIGQNESKKISLDYLFGQDRYLVTPGSYNTKATFFTVKALDEPASTQITLNYKEQ